MLAASKARELVERATDWDGDPDMADPGEAPLGAAGHLADWYPRSGG